ncbi:MAG: class I SAM-dependent methyltransferase, partial [Planctomycetota bacterium]
MAEDPHTVSLATAEEIDAYAETHLLRDPAVAEALSAAAAASASAGLPDIRVSQLQAMQLRMFVQAVGARRVLEVGTLGGYSAIAMASALPGEGRVVSLEISPHHAETAQNNLKNAGLSGRVEVRVGPAIERLDAMVKG